MTGPEAGEAEGVARERFDLRLLTLIASLLVAVTVSLTFMQVILRYFFNNPQTWVEEVGRYLFVWITFLGVAAAYFRDTHIRVDAVMSLIGGRVQRGADLLRRFVDAAAIAALLYSGILVAWKQRFTKFYTMPDVPQVIFYLAVPVCAAFALVYVVHGIVRWTRSKEG